MKNKTPQNVASLYMMYVIVIVNIVLTGMCIAQEDYTSATFVGICTALSYLFTKATRRKIGI